MLCCGHDMKLTVYVVEDDEAVRNSLRTILEIYGYSVASFAAGEEFLEHADVTARKVVILDVNLPGASGLEILKRLRDDDKFIPAIVVSGRADNDMRAQAIRLGARAFLEKPIEIDALLAVINSIDAAPKLDSDIANP